MSVSSPTSRMLRTLGVFAGIVVLSAAACAQNECTVREMRPIAFMSEGGVSHQVLCWDKQNERACSPSTGACGALSAAAQAPVASAKPATQATTVEDDLPVNAPALETSVEPDAPPFQAGADGLDEGRPRSSGGENRAKPASDERDENRTKPPTDDQQVQSSSQLTVKIPERQNKPATAAQPVAGLTPGTIEIVPQSTTVRVVPIANGASAARSPIEIQEELAKPSGPPPREMAGQADVAIQGYYQATTGQSLADITGTAVKFQNFFPSIGLLSASFEGYGNHGRFRLGENFARLSGVSFLGQHWDFGGGDFRVPLGTVDRIFPNIFTQDLFVRGIDVTISSSRRTLRLFSGEETLMQGPQVPFRTVAPQSVAGAVLQQRYAHLQLGLRYVHTSSSASQIADNPAFFPNGRQFLSGDSLTLQALYRPMKHVRLFAEGGVSRAEQQVAVEQTPRNVSFVAGPEFDTKRLTLRANYVLQGNSYLPLAGYYAGDRQGPFGEIKFRPFRAVELFASASRYSSNVDRNPEVPTFRAAGYNGGIAAMLPWKLSASAQVSSIDLNSSAVPFNNTAAVRMDNRQWSLSLSRPIAHQTLRASLMELDNRVNAITTIQRMSELEDSFTWRRLSLAGAVRLQRSAGVDAKDSVYYRGSVQFNLRKVSLYGSMEAGNDVVNKTLLATNSLNSTVLGATAPLFRGWSLQFEAFRNNLTTDLNPASIFVLEGRGVDVPMTLASLNQWSVFFRLTKQLRWGASTAAETMEQYTARQMPLVGTVDGRVTENVLAGNHGAAGIPVRIDGYRTVFTDSTGYFQFAEVPEGVHRVSPAIDELPADLELDGINAVDVTVTPRLHSRADFAVAPLVSVAGKVTAPKDVAVENIIIRVKPSARYTTPDPDGSFSFFNLREGMYEISIDRDTLPPDVVITSAPTSVVTLETGKQPPSSDFVLAVEHRELPVQRVIDLHIDLGAGGQGPQFQPQRQKEK